MKDISLLDKHFRVIISCAQIKTGIEHVADRINSDYRDREILFIAVLNGSFMFAAELVRRIKPLCRVSFVKVATYQGDVSGGVVKELIGLKEDLNGKHVILVEDIVDTGFTLDHVMAQIKSNYRPSSVAVATLLFKPQSYRKSIPVDYVGFEIPNDFVIGWGLDYNGYGRNLENIYSIAE
ncbi:MAG: hypoxanthine phosphoribosyltransferase [Bacteroidales bacterium]|jgi:hypoxanthine phosphoribosyltransferase|nr:hypoxanthine phosphoribosyltransferase [Bacteroidales bacterium]